MDRPETPPLPVEVSVGTQMTGPDPEPIASPVVTGGAALEEISESKEPPHVEPNPPGEPSTASAEQPEDSAEPVQRLFNPVRTILSVGVGFIAVFLFLRTFAIEPFGVPTGSMAPSLIGNHREGPCPRCGYPVRVGFPLVGANQTDQFSNVGCPNCGKRFSLLEAPALNGDRLLVDKNVFNLRRPRRWEMAVFHCPDTDPKEIGKPYVKRIIGLPGETIRLIDGEVYADGVLARKDLAEIRETRIPVFDMAYVPNPGGWKSRWLVEPPENDPRLPRATGRQLQEADSGVVDGSVITLDAADSAQPSAGLRYRHWNLDDEREERIRAWSSYDSFPRSFHQLPPIHDFSLVCDLEVVSALPDAIFECGLTDGKDTVLAEITVGPRAAGLATLTHYRQGGLGSVRGVSLEQGRSYRLEFAFVDRRVSLALDGKLALPPADLAAVEKRDEVRHPVQLRARNCRLKIHNFALYRDIYYTQYGEHGTQQPAVLGPSEFFVLGDNSGNSQDSRKWPTPGVPESDFIGKPFLIHQPLRPARISLGGQERVFQTVDWSRLRWLH